MDIGKYLERIGVRTPLSPDLAGLTKLHRAHLRAIPYENLDVQLGRSVSIERPAIYDKLVTRHRGGWCYEMNGLFGWALGELGFRVTRATGAVVRHLMGAASVGNHLVLKVELPEGLYLADVGFGDGPIDPIRVAPGAFESGGFRFSLAQADSGWWRLTNHPFGGAPAFDFNLDPADEALLAERCDYLRNSPQSPFVQNLVSQRFVPDGLLVLRGRTLRRITPESKSDRLIMSAEELVQVLRHEFDLDVPEAASLWSKICERHEAIAAPAAAAAGASGGK